MNFKGYIEVEHMKINNRVMELLNIEYPIIQGGMAWVAEYHLASAVSEAGGLGIIAAGNAPASWVREQIRELRKLTNKPFGVNVMLMSPEADEVAKVLAQEKVPVVTTGAGNPEKYMEKGAMLRNITIVKKPSLPSSRYIFQIGRTAILAQIRSAQRKSAVKKERSFTITT